MYSSCGCNLYENVMMIFFIVLQLLSENKKQPTVWGTFMLSYEHIEISYQCVKNYAGWNVFNSSQKVL